MENLSSRHRKNENKNIKWLSNFYLEIEKFNEYHQPPKFIINNVFSFYEEKSKGSNLTRFRITVAGFDVNLRSIIPKHYCSSTTIFCFTFKSKKLSQVCWKKESKERENFPKWVPTKRQRTISFALKKIVKKKICRLHFRGEKGEKVAFGFAVNLVFVAKTVVTLSIGMNILPKVWDGVPTSKILAPKMFQAERGIMQKMTLTLQGST